MYDSSQMTILTLFVSHSSVKTHLENYLFTKHLLDQETFDSSVSVQSECADYVSMTDDW